MDGREPGGTGQFGPKGSKLMEMLRLQAGHGDPRAQDREGAGSVPSRPGRNRRSLWLGGWASFPRNLQFACQTVRDELRGLAPTPTFSTFG